MKFELYIEEMNLSELIKLTEFLSQETIGDTTPIEQPIIECDAAPTIEWGITEQPSTPSVCTDELDPKSLDADGLPWDERIHSSPPKRTGKNLWGARRGRQPVTYDEVKAELLNAAPVAPVAAAPVAPVAAAPVAPVAAAPVAPVAAAPVAPVAAAPQVERNFAGLMSTISQMYDVGTLTDPMYSNSIVQRINGVDDWDIQTLTDIARDPVMVDYAWQCLEIDTGVAG